MAYTVTIEKQSDGTFIAYNNKLESTVIGSGNTIDEAKEDYKNSLAEIKELWEEEGKELPSVCSQTPIFKFDLSSFFEYYSALNMAGFAKFVGINATLLRQYKSGNTYISEKQLKKIEEGVHRLGAELSALKLV